MRVLITGTGRCGTGWMARALTAAGAPCGHEAAFTARGHGDCDWVAESSWLAAPYLDRLDGVYVVHLVRDPLKTIASRAATPTFRPRLSGHGRFAVHHAPTSCAATAGWNGRRGTGCAGPASSPRGARTRFCGWRT